MRLEGFSILLHIREVQYREVNDRNIQTTALRTKFDIL